ncbi:MAG: DUF1569 domain-containing protein [Blastocatellia bacterium]
MKTLGQTDNLEEIRRRIMRVRPDSPRQWGRMTQHQMLCHLCDAFAVVMGIRAEEPHDNLFTRTIMKWLALRAPMPWPHGIKTGVKSDQEREGTPPVEFARDRRKLLGLLGQFMEAQKDLSSMSHPIFGRMTAWEWGRWGYLHCDHHLRQFGV